MNTSHLLLDIEGTTCPVSFVGDVLFPYASRSLETYLVRSEADATIESLLDDAEQEWQGDGSAESTSLRLATKVNGMNRIQAITQYLQHLIAIDRKSTVLKDIQGKIWNEGYGSGELKSQLFEEAPSCLRRWHANNLTLAVYSSGSIEAQKLLYRHTTAGGLDHLFADWFDTKTGPKKHRESYIEIAKAMNTACHQILFISDNGEECDAAEAAGMKTLFSLREGNPDQNPRHHEVISTLNSVDQFLERGTAQQAQ